jgi:hypothetical protein
MKTIRFFIVLIALGACVDPIELDLYSSGFPLFVDAQITNEERPYTVKLFYSAPLGSTLKKLTPERMAKVVIESDANESEQLSEVAPGIYQTSITGIRGQIGRSYTLTIETKNGKVYQTEPQTLKSPGIIEQIYTEFQEDQVPFDEPTDDSPTDELSDALTLYADAEGVPEESTLLRWKVMGLYEMKTFPELNREATPGGYIPDPLPCSGYIARGLAIQKIAECTCCTCYLYEYSDNSVISENENVSDFNFNKVNLGQIPVTPMRFYRKYYVEVSQMSVSQEVYDFWRLVKKQQESKGSIFQPNSVKVRGNIKCISDPNEEVFGIFSVSGVVKAEIFIQPDELPVTLQIDTLTSDCREYANATTIKPWFW